MSESVIKKIEDILKNKSGLEFDICSTPYGRECTSRADFNDELLSKNLKEAVLNFDYEYHDELDLDIGNSRTYKFTYENEVSLEILYRSFDEEDAESIENWTDNIDFEILQKFIK